MSYKHDDPAGHLPKNQECSLSHLAGLGFYTSLGVLECELLKAKLTHMNSLTESVNKS